MSRRDVESLTARIDSFRFLKDRCFVKRFNRNITEIRLIWTIRSRFGHINQRANGVYNVKKRLMSFRFKGRALIGALEE